jgi:hypothetical protein
MKTEVMPSFGVDSGLKGLQIMGVELPEKVTLHI